MTEGRTFISELRDLINRYGRENASNTPDYILAYYLESCLLAFQEATQQRETWYGRDASPTLTPMAVPPEANAMTDRPASALSEEELAVIEARFKSEVRTSSDGNKPDMSPAARVVCGAVAGDGLRLVAEVRRLRAENAACMESLGRVEASRESEERNRAEATEAAYRYMARVERAVAELAALRSEQERVARLQWANHLAVLSAAGGDTQKEVGHGKVS
jgi:hypothetical protein